MIINDEPTNEPQGGEERCRKKRPSIPFIIAFFLLYYLLYIYHFNQNSPAFLCDIFTIIPHHHRHGGINTQCQSNLKNIGTALEMYSIDNKGQFPYSLNMLVPEYIEKIPKCAAAGKDTYSASYTVEWSHSAYTMFCSGHYHAKLGVGPNYPQYNSREWLVPK